MSGVVHKLGFHTGSPLARGETLLDLEFESDIDRKHRSMVRILETIGGRWPLGAESKKKIELCLDEAFQNAIVWGNGGNPAKKVRVRLWSEDGRWGITISDEGNGFSPSSLPDYEGEDFLWQDHGRGVFILLNYLAEVAYYDGGRTLVLKS